MKIGRIPDRIPARTIADIELKDDVFKADFALTDKYQSFSAELLRLALLGIGGFGFLLANLLPGRGPEPSLLFLRLQQQELLLAVGVVALGVAAAFAVAHRFFSTDCLAHQITILRLLKRTTDDTWSEPERAAAATRLDNERAEQRRDLRRCRVLLTVAAISLVVGVISVAVTFARVLADS